MSVDGVFALAGGLRLQLSQQRTFKSERFHFCGAIAPFVVTSARRAASAPAGAEPFGSSARQDDRTLPTYGLSAIFGEYFSKSGIRSYGSARNTWAVCLGVEAHMAAVSIGRRLHQ